MAIRLTDAEQDVLVALAQCGGQRRMMAEQLRIARPTLNTHMTRLFRKTGAQSSVQLLRWALREAHKIGGDRPLRVAAIVGPGREIHDQG